MASPETDPNKSPILLLKTKSMPADAYQDLFSTPPSRGNISFEPIFVPVLQHRFEEQGQSQLRALLEQKRISASRDAAYGGLIFTSQRAVEVFATLVEDGLQKNDNSSEEHGSKTWPHLQDVPLYSVGPATTRALKSIPQDPPLQIFGEHTGNGDALAAYIQEHYGSLYAGRNPKPPLLFLVGEQRRDIIPKTLMDERLPVDNRIHVDEMVVYGTGVMESFPGDLNRVLERTADRGATRWLVIFSPTGCDGMLKGLGMLDEETGKVRHLPREEDKQTNTYIASIGPTTRNYLKRTFDYEPDVCAEKPSPEGLWEAITTFMESRK
ncbi:tetrapyrrole biosynthesis, uroporphyrinogen III synthase [Pseudomassariella vexata]|uniref:Tetrapyrrole biosynthesis, uroporphyrinogen III synthase n=1 Tax=Pseudomassariella vexata TaxID=1141098 RepID=A0A1Y2DNY8_9PEZI|nr:tetrapyrrole biosynthesis, uroporphyrinogen III synthase [Pseudomassariella vexata]ORY60884.1 tetrapyrrole biosynthesis, uroporphyrinogen III synthase [Pseudomassariella vexata]